MAGIRGWGAALACALALGACVLPGTGGGDRGLRPNPVTGDTIEVTALDAPAAGAKAAPGGASGAAPAAAAAVRAPGPGDPRPRPRPEGAAAALSPVPDAAEAPAAPVAAPAVPEAEKSAAQLACEKKKGRWSRAGKGGFTCISKTRDGGKACRKATDCEGQCLARSLTCAPFKPLFGCNEILDDIGRRMTLCID